MAWKKPGIHIFLLLVNLFFGFILTVPFYRAMMTNLGHSLMGETLSRGFNSAWFAEFTFKDPIFLETMGSMILPVAIGYVFLWSILSGGILEVFKPDGEGRWSRRFSSGVARYCLPFFRLTLIASALYLATYWFLMIKGWEKAMKWIENSPSPQLEFFTGVGLAFLTIIILLFFDMIFDYARIKQVTEDRRSVVFAIIGALLFCARHIRQSMCLYGLLLILSGVWIAAYLAIYTVIPQYHLVGIVFLLIIQEIFMLGRIFIRVSTYSCQMGFFLRSKASGLEPSS